MAPEHKPFEPFGLVVLVADDNHRRDSIRSHLVYGLSGGIGYLFNITDRTQEESTRFFQEWLGNNYLLHTHSHCGSAHSCPAPDSSANGNLLADACGNSSGGQPDFP